MTTATDLPPAELQAAARASYLEAAATGQPPTGAELGRQFHRSGRWGRDRIAECRPHLGPDAPKPDDTNLATVAAIGDADTAPVDADALSASTTASTSEHGSHHSTMGQQADDAASRPWQPRGPNGSHVAVAHGHVAATPVQALAGWQPEAMWSRRIIRWITTAAVIVVAACAARSSYEHQRTVVEMAGNPEAAWYLPLSVDGMMLVASLNMLVRRWDAEPAGWLTWTALLLGGAASLAANIAAAPPTWIGRLVAAWSPICLIVSYELLMQQLPNRAPTRDPAPMAESCP